MRCIYMINQNACSIQTVGSLLPECADQTLQKITFTGTGAEPVFRTMKRIYQFLDTWSRSYSDCSILLTVDSRASKIVHSYFCEMSDSEYRNFSLPDDQVCRYTPGKSPYMSMSSINDMQNII